MKANNKKSGKRIVLYSFLIILTIILLLFNSLASFVIVNISLILFLYFVVKIDIKNPLFLLTLVFCLYQISYPILNTLGIKVFEYAQLNDSYYIYSWLATTTYIIAYGSIADVKYNNNQIKYKTNSSLLKIIYAFLILISIVASINVMQNGYSSKYALANASNLLIKLGSMSYTTIIIFPLYFLLNPNINEKKKIAITVINLLIVMFGMFTYGERSYVINYLIVLGIYYSTTHKVTTKQIVLSIIAAIIFISASSSMKMLFINDNYRNAKDFDNGIVVAFLNSDFASAGFNFNYLLNNNANGVMGGNSYIYDILSPFDDIINIDKYSATKWYQNRYWRDRKTGLGFTIIGEGYINYGIVGIVVEMVIFARIIKYFYTKSNKNYARYILYIGCITLAMYSCREALGNIISPLIKYYLLLTIIVIIINGIESGKKK